MIFVLLLFAVAGGSGCGSAAPEFTSVEDYINGKLTPGWYYEGMSAEEMKSYIDGMTDSRAKELALKFFEEKYFLKQTTITTLPKDSIVFGTVAITNQLNKDLLIGADLIGSDSLSEIGHPTWFVAANSTIFEVIPPGNYVPWFDWGGKRKECRRNLKIGVETTWHIDRNVNGIIVVTQP